MPEPQPTPDSAVPLRIPADWEVAVDPAPGTSLVAREPAAATTADAADAASEDAERFRANLVATAVATGGMSFRDWQVGTEELLPRVLDDYLVVDLERLVIDDRPAGRRLAHHAGPAGEALTMEQWFTLVEGIGHTLTFTTETWRYDELADLAAAIARTWHPGAGASDAG